MNGRYLISRSQPFSKEGNIFANRSSLVLEWVLRKGGKKEVFSLREVSLETGVSLGLVQRVFSTLVYYGILRTHGLRTAKSFSLSSKRKLLELWNEHYDVIKKCKIWTYTSAYNLDELEKILSQSSLSNQVALALHSSARARNLSISNLQTLELYMLDTSKRTNLEYLLKLTPKEKGYEVLLIEPYYRDLISSSHDQFKGIKISSPIITYLDLYHFPLRGPEQAEYLLKNAPELFG